MKGKEMQHQEIPAQAYTAMESTAMSSHSTSKIFIIGGTRAQGIPIIHAQVAAGAYSPPTLERLRQIKQTVDPHGVVRGNRIVPWSAAGDRR
jgi:hypothetical protein